MSSTTTATKKRYKYTPNTYRLDGDVAHLALTRQDGSTAAEVSIDATDLPLALGLGRWVLQVIRHKSGTQFTYARNSTRVNGKIKITYLHRLITQAQTGMDVDHINHNTLDCTRDNLRIVTRAQNNQNRLNTNPHSRTGIRNVYLDEGKYQVVITLDGKQYNVGRYNTLDEAAQAAHRARLELHPCYVPDDTTTEDMTLLAA